MVIQVMDQEPLNDFGWCDADADFVHQIDQACNVS